VKNEWWQMGYRKKVMQWETVRNVTGMNDRRAVPWATSLAVGLMHE
jgi:hypothetical protein